jgi:hypothetical protein
VSRLPVRTETLLVLACAGAAGLLAASELMTTFEFTPSGGEAIREQTAGDRHAYSLLVLALFALGSLLVAVAWGSKPAAIAVAVAGGIALLMFLINDLPDANKVGTLDDAGESFIDAKAEPQLGFWLELIGALLLTVCGVALATLTPVQLEQAGRPVAAAANPEPSVRADRSSPGERLDGERKTGLARIPGWPSRR